MLKKNIRLNYEIMLDTESYMKKLLQIIYNFNTKRSFKFKFPKNNVTNN